MQWMRCAGWVMPALCALFGAVALPALAQNNPVVEMTVAGRGKVLIELYPKDAPKTVAHFLDLVRKKFYDGILVHRVVDGFVVQAGDPKSRQFRKEQLVGKSDEEVAAMGLGDGGSGKNIPFEENKRTHEAGTIAMALSSPHSDTGDSQWFINLEANHRLDGNYCVFGRVRKGMDVVRKIQRGDKIDKMVIVPPKKGRRR